MAAAGIDDIFIAYPVWADGPKADRLREPPRPAPLASGSTRSPARSASRRRSPGSSTRCGYWSRWIGLAERVCADPVPRSRWPCGARARARRERGVHPRRPRLPGPGARVGAAADEVATLGAAADAFRADGFAVQRISAGSTPTAVLAAAGQVNEIRAGTYLVGDRTQIALGVDPRRRPGARVAATVVSTAVAGQVVVDAGAKTLTKDRAPYLEGSGPSRPTRRPSSSGSPTTTAVVDPAGHARTPARGGRRDRPEPRLSGRRSLRPFVAVRAGASRSWPVDARGRSG